MSGDWLPRRTGRTENRSFARTYTCQGNMIARLPSTKIKTARRHFPRGSNMTLEPMSVRAEVLSLKKEVVITSYSRTLESIAGRLVLVRTASFG